MTFQILNPSQVEYLKDMEMYAIQLLNAGKDSSVIIDKFERDYGDLVPYEIIRMVVTSAKQLSTL